jgi:hypothetical protein
MGYFILCNVAVTRPAPFASALRLGATILAPKAGEAERGRRFMHLTRPHARIETLTEEL